VQPAILFRYAKEDIEPECQELLRNTWVFMHGDAVSKKSRIHYPVIDANTFVLNLIAIV
jgi:hypothetical protein